MCGFTKSHETSVSGHLQSGKHTVIILNGDRMMWRVFRRIIASVLFEKQATSTIIAQMAFTYYSAWLICFLKTHTSVPVIAKKTI